MDDHRDDDDRYHGAGCIHAIVIGTGWWLLAIWAFTEHGLAGLAIVVGVLFLLAAALVSLR
jgi:hypothetical protein